ncbi:MAG: hypothetical protein KTR31_16900 [Myxococcales bacterium]|nr:hypothetical protein [Myxococcales bacterium]
MRWIGLVAALVGVACRGAATVVDRGPDPPIVDTAALQCTEEDLATSYGRYVEPFVSGTTATSCGQCHMTGVDLGLYVQDTPCETFACMEQLGVVDADDPSSSTILAQIRMGDPQSSVFDVEAEASAMEAWIRWNASCHEEVCGSVEDACAAGTGAASTGRTPIGDCSEEDLLGVFWDSVIVDRGRCLICHSDVGQEQGTFGPCETTEDCELQQICEEGTCYAPGPLLAPHFFEGTTGALQWSDAEHRQIGLNTMYNVVALGLVSTSSPLDSPLLTKPLLEDFTPTQIHGPGISLSSVSTGTGVAHGGTSKFNFGCHHPPCLDAAPVDCRTEQRCGDVPCPDGQVCSEGFCRTIGSVCDPTYVAYARFALYLQECDGG